MWSDWQLLTADWNEVIWLDYVLSLSSPGGFRHQAYEWFTSCIFELENTNFLKSHVIIGVAKFNHILLAFSFEYKVLFINLHYWIEIDLTASDFKKDFYSQVCKYKLVNNSKDWGRVTLLWLALLDDLFLHCLLVKWLRESFVTIFVGANLTNTFELVNTSARVFKRICVK